MIKENNILYIKKKFATLLSKIYTDGKISIDEINDKLIHNGFLNCFETNELDYFIDKSYEAIIKDMFNKETVFNEEINAAIYWCGIQYMNIFLNKNIPLKQIILLCPINEMLKNYNFYHELAEKELIERFFEVNYSRSILRLLIKESGYTIKEISYLCDISENTIKYYEISNVNLFNASFNNIDRLMNILNVDNTYFYENSKFIPFSKSLLTNKDTRKMIDAYINGYYGEKTDVYYENGLFYIKKGNKKEFVDEKVVKNSIKYAVLEYKGDKMLF